MRRLRCSRDVDDSSAQCTDDQRVAIMQGPPLKRLQCVALITRDHAQYFPRNELKTLLADDGVQLVEGGGHQGVDAVIAMGGDGTVLKALSAYPLSPTLAINFGRVGFLTQGDREDLEPMVKRVLNGEYFIEQRLAIEVSVTSPQAEQRPARRCINEVVFKGIAHMNELTLSIDGDSVHTLRGDGIIIGTPTGSTAYLMSTGAPLVTPGVSCIIASPLNEYRFSSRPMILPGEAQLTVNVDHARPRDLMLIIDGEEPIPLEQGARVSIRRSSHPTLLMAFEPQFFFRNLRERLNW